MALIIAFQAISNQFNSLSSSSFNPDSLDTTPSTMTTLDDIVKLFKASDDNRSNERAQDKEDISKQCEKDKEERAKEMANLTETVSGLIKYGVKDEVESALKPFQEAQSILSEEHKKLVETVSSLKVELESFKTGSKPKGNPETTVTAESISPISSNEAHQDERVEIAKTGKRIIGFSPITTAHIEHAKAEYNIEDDHEARIAAVKDLLYFEMKIPAEQIREMKQKRVFAPVNKPKKHPERFYVEFYEESSVKTIYSYVHNLNPEIRIHPYIPHQFYERFQVMDDLALKIREGPGNFKTKIQFGYSDLLLYKKGPSNLSWDIVQIKGSLPPVNLAPRRPQTSSPPPGRPGLLKRKERSPLSDSVSRSAKSRRSWSPTVEETTEAGQNNTPMENEPETDNNSLNC